MTLLLGIDTGGTFTDAVAVTAEGGELVASAKAPTTHDDLTVGIGAALDEILAVPGVEPRSIGLVSLSTTLATNALVEGHGEPAALVAVGFTPDELARALGDLGADPLIPIAGGHDAFGREVEPVDLAALDDALAAAEQLPAAFAVVAPFSVRNPDHELAVRRALTATGRPVTCSHELSARLDGPRRALTALLNARLIGVIGRLQAGVRTALDRAAIVAPIMVVRGDGSLVADSYAAERPIETILSGPAASVVGARHLAGVDDGLVVDVGGTTTDLAALHGGEPAVGDDGAEVGGHRTMVAAVESRTVGIGGDSEVRLAADAAGGDRAPSHRRSVAGVSGDDRDEPGAGLGALVLGPARAVPLCRLAVDHPEVVEQLRRQLADPVPAAGHARFLVVGGPIGLRPLDESERAVVAGLAAGPRPERELQVSSRHRRAVDRLRARGIVRIGTVTPTDAACRLGHLGGGPGAAGGLDPEAARLGLALLARRSTPGGSFLAAGPDELAAAIEELVIARSASAVLETALRADGLVPDGPGSEPPGDIAGWAVVRAGLTGHRGAVRVDVAVTGPVVAVGAPAVTYHPAVADRLGASAVVPAGAEVANAVGAAVAPVRLRRSVTITRPRAGRFVLHVEGQPAFPSLAAARREGERVLGAELTRLARSAGASGVEVGFTWAERSAVVGGRDLLVEAELTGTASGRPRLG